MLSESLTVNKSSIRTQDCACQLDYLKGLKQEVLLQLGFVYRFTINNCLFIVGMESWPGLLSATSEKSELIARLRQINTASLIVQIFQDRIYVSYFYAWLCQSQSKQKVAQRCQKPDNQVCEICFTSRHVQHNDIINSLIISYHLLFLFLFPGF